MPISAQHDMANDTLIAQRIRLRGRIQGVGFRPFTVRLAQRHDVRGWVRNVGGEVEIHAEGRPEPLARFVAGLTAEAPQLADALAFLQAARDWPPAVEFADVMLYDPVPMRLARRANFERALYAAYMGGDWKIANGNGEGATVQFQANGQVAGLPGADRYSLCLAGDCASMSGGYDSMWLQRNGVGNAWIFARKGKQLEIFQAINTSQADEVPSFTPGPRQWLLEKQ